MSDYYSCVFRSDKCDESDCWLCVYNDNDDEEDDE